MSQRAIPPRPSTAGRQRSASASREAGMLSTPRGTASVPFPDSGGGASGDSSAARGGVAAPLSVNGSHAERVDCAVQTDESSRSFAEQQMSSRAAAAVEAEMREFHNRLLEHQNASSALMSRAVAALEAKVQQAHVVSQAVRLHESGTERIRVLESETRELRAALAKKHDELVTVKRQLVQYRATYGPAFSTLKSGCRPPIVLDVSHLLAAAAAEASGSLAAPHGRQSRPTCANSLVATDVPKAPDPAEEECGASQSLRHVPADGAALRISSAVSSLERMKREWKMQQQQQHPHGLGAPRGMLSHDAVSMSAVAVPLTMTSISAVLSENGTSAQQQQLQQHQETSSLSREWQAVGAASANTGTSRAVAEAMAAQAEIIKSLEKENELLRHQRDATVRHNQQEHQRLMQELEEAHQSLDEQGADFSEKQKELQRLRTLMRFSQLKRDSDKLQETFQRLDDLENKLRSMHHQQHRHALDQDDLQRLRIIELQLCKILRGELPWSSFPKEMLMALPIPATAPASNTRGSGGGSTSASALQHNYTNRSVPAGTTCVVGSQPVEQRLVHLNSVTPKLPARPSTAKVSSSSSVTAVHSGDDVRSAQVATASPGAGPGPASREYSNPSPQQNAQPSAAAAPRNAAPSATVTKQTKQPHEEDEGYVYDDVEDDAEASRGHHHAPPPAPMSQGRCSASGSDVPAASKPTDRDGRQPVVRDEDVSFSTITDRMKAYLERRARQQQQQAQQDAAAQGLRATETAAAERKRQQLQAQALESRSNSLSMSNFGRRLDLLRQQSGSIGDDSTTTLSSSAAALSSRPLSAVRASPSVAAATAAGTPTMSLLHSVAAPVRPSTASNKRTASLGRPAAKETTEPPRQFAYIGGRMVPVR